MSDLFQEGVPESYIEAVCRVWSQRMAYLSGAYQALGKIETNCAGQLRFAAEQEHIWWGVSVEDKKYGLPRIGHLQDAPARVRFLSVEPLLEGLGEFNLSGISWAIVGGESGPGARPMRREWVISVRDQCRKYHVPFFFKQWGGVRKAKNGRLLDDRTYDEYPERIASSGPRSCELRGLCAGDSEFVRINRCMRRRRPNPSGAKAQHHVAESYGTAEAVPFHKSFPRQIFPSSISRFTTWLKTG